MLVALLLNFSARDAAFLGGLVWKVGFVLWVPQLLALVYVLRTRSRRPQSLLAELGLLVLPWVLVVAALWGSTFGPLLLLIPFYAEVHWGWWLCVVLLPTVTSLVSVGATHRLTPAEAAARLAPPTPWFRSPLLYVVLGVAFLVLRAAWGLQTMPTEGRTQHWVPPDPAERARQDSARVRRNEARAQIEFDSLEQARSPSEGSPW